MLDANPVEYAVFSILKVESLEDVLIMGPESVQTVAKTWVSDRNKPAIICGVSSALGGTLGYAAFSGLRQTVPYSDDNETIYRNSAICLGTALGLAVGKLINTCLSGRQCQPMLQQPFHKQSIPEESPASEVLKMQPDRKLSELDPKLLEILKEKNYFHGNDRRTYLFARAVSRNLLMEEAKYLRQIIQIPEFKNNFEILAYLQEKEVSLFELVETFEDSIDYKYFANSLLSSLSALENIPLIPEEIDNEKYSSFFQKTCEELFQEYGEDAIKKIVEIFFNGLYTSYVGDNLLWITLRLFDCKDAFDNKTIDKARKLSFYKNSAVEFENKSKELIDLNMQRIFGGKEVHFSIIFNFIEELHVGAILNTVTPDLDHLLDTHKNRTPVEEQGFSTDDD